MSLPGRFLPFLFALGAVSVASAQEFGVDSTTSLGYATAAVETVTLSDRLDGWYTFPIGTNGGGFEARAHAEMGIPDGFLADLDVLAVTLVYPKPGVDLKSLKWTLGRYAFSDTTGLILNHPLDGSAIDFNFGSFDLKLSGGYTGFVTRATSEVVLSLADQQSTALFATPRVVGALETSWTLFDSHTLTLGALAQEDLTSPDKLVEEWSPGPDPVKGGRVDTQYLTLKFDGPVIERLFYNASFTFESGNTLSLIPDSNVSGTYEYKPITAFLTSAGVTYFVPTFFSSSWEARILFASGDPDSRSAVEGNTEGNSTLFVPMTSTTLGVVFNPTLSNLGFYELGGSLKPLPSIPFVVVAKVLGFQRLVAGAINAPGVVGGGPPWMGEEVDVSGSWQVYSDLQVSTSLGTFFPTSGTMAASVPTFQYAGSVGAKLSL